MQVVARLLQSSTLIAPPYFFCKSVVMPTFAVFFCHIFDHCSNRSIELHSVFGCDDWVSEFLFIPPPRISGHAALRLKASWFSAILCGFRVFVSYVFVASASILSVISRALMLSRFFSAFSAACTAGYSYPTMPV